MLYSIEKNLKIFAINRNFPLNLSPIMLSYSYRLTKKPVFPKLPRMEFQMAKTTALVSLDQHIAAQAPVVAETPKSHKKDRPAVTKEQVLAGPVAAKQVPFRIIEDVRPTAGGRLFAFTQAWLEVSGMQDGKGFDKDQARLLAGNTAIAYHMKLGNFEMQKDGLHLSIKGANFFKARVLDNKVDPKQVEGFKAIFTTGKMDGDLVKNQHFIKAM